MSEVKVCNGLCPYYFMAPSPCGGLVMFCTKAQKAVKHGSVCIVTDGEVKT